MVSLFRQGMEDPEALELQYITSILHRRQDRDPNCRGMPGEKQNQGVNQMQVPSVKSARSHIFIIVWLFSLDLA